MSQDHQGRDRARMYNVQEVADELHICVRSVWRLIKDQKLKVVRIGRAVRIDAESLDAFIAQGGER